MTENCWNWKEPENGQETEKEHERTCEKPGGERIRDGDDAKRLSEKSLFSQYYLIEALGKTEREDSGNKWHTARLYLGITQNSR